MGVFDTLDNVVKERRFKADIYKMMLKHIEEKLCVNSMGRVYRYKTCKLDKQNVIQFMSEFAMHVGTNYASLRGVPKEDYKEAEANRIIDIIKEDRIRFIDMRRDLKVFNIVLYSYETPAEPEEEDEPIVEPDFAYEEMPL